MGSDCFWYGGWLFPMIMPVVMLTVFLILVYVIFGRGCSRPPWSEESGRHHPIGKSAESPLEILRRRYARGEITKEEFEQIRKDITGS